MLTRSINWLLIPLSISNGCLCFSVSTRIAQHRTLNSFYHTTLTARMPRGVKKENLPIKDCVVCGRPFTWRKKWERCWDEVTTCSKSCNSKRRNTNRSTMEILNDLLVVSFSSESVKNTESSELNFTSIQHDTLQLKSPPSKLLLPLVDFEDAPETSKCFSYDLDETLEFTDDAKAERKVAKKMIKAARRNQRQGLGDPARGQKSCDMCSRSVDLLVRCQYDESKQWKMICGKCWKISSGGVVDGDANHPNYRYGGLWKNRSKRS